jgi:ATP-binding cassette subfamily B protein
MVINMKQDHDVKDLPKTLLPFIWRYLKDKKLFLAVFFLTGLIWAVEMSLSPYLLKVIIDAVVQNSQDKAKMLAATLIPAILFVLMPVILNFTFCLYNYANLRLYPAIKSAVGKDMFAYLMRHSHAFFQNNFSGSLTRKIFNMADVEQIISIFNEWFYPRIFAIIISTVTLFLVVQPIFGVILFVWAVSFIYLSYISAKKSEKMARKFSEAEARMSGTISDSISNVMSTKLFSNIPNEIDYVSKDINQLVDCDRKLQWKNLKVNFIQEWGVTILVGSMLTALIYGCIHDWVTAGDFALVLMLSMSFIRSVRDMGQQMLKFSKVIGTCNQALSFIQVPHEITDTSTASPIKITKGEIKFENVSFQHENSNPLFQKLNITINPGQKVGLVGYSGGGKSTFIKLILRLVDTQSGHVLIDGQDVKNVTKHSLRKQIGTIPQEPDLFHRTLMENIRFAKTDASDHDVIEAAKKARCHVCFR